MLIALRCWLIDGGEIDYARARGAEGRKEPRAARWRELLRNRSLVYFALCLFLFQFADASMLPLASERLAVQDKGLSELVTALLVAVPQFVTALIAAWVARKADERGRKWLLLGAFLTLAARAALFALPFGPWFLVGVQTLGGLTSAVIGILTPLVVADVTKRTGRYNFALGAVIMASGVGAAVSTTAIGLLAEALGFAVGFGALAFVAGLGFAAVWLLIPETSGAAREDD